MVGEVIMEPGEIHSGVVHEGRGALAYQAQWLDNALASFYMASAGPDASVAFSRFRLPINHSKAFAGSQTSWRVEKGWRGYVHAPLMLLQETWGGGFLSFTSPKRKPANWALLELFYDDTGGLSKVLLSGFDEREESRLVGYGDASYWESYWEADLEVVYDYRWYQGKITLGPLPRNAEALGLWAPTGLETVVFRNEKMISIPFSLRSQGSIYRYSFQFPLVVDYDAELKQCQRNQRLKVFGGLPTKFHLVGI